MDLAACARSGTVQVSTCMGKAALLEHLLSKLQSRALESSGREQSNLHLGHTQVSAPFERSGARPPADHYRFDVSNSSRNQESVTDESHLVETGGNTLHATERRSPAGRHIGQAIEDKYDYDKSSRLEAGIHKRTLTLTLTLIPIGG